MNQNLLIDAIVRQTMVLIAQLATASGARTPLSHLANQVFLDLVRELQDAGLGQKIIADMFGMALRTYHERVRRLSESATDRGRTLWEAVYEHIKESESITRAAILRRFRRDDPLMVRSILSDLVDTGLVFRSGKGDRTAYRAVDPAELKALANDDVEVRRTLLWVAVHRLGPCSEETLLKQVTLNASDLRAELDQLVAEGKVRREECGSETLYRADACIIPFESDAGWEAAVFDHYQAMVTALVTKLQMETRARPDDRVGGSTYAFDVWPGHPLEDRVHGLLGEVRRLASELRSEVDAHNRGGQPVDGVKRVTFYVGQTLPLDDEDDDA